ncbi:MAG TPA: ADP-glyceromanno-heptose 6-epimerase [Burkholderiales bacterium]
MLVVVTGAAGFIGSRLVAALNRRGMKEILAVDDLSRGDNARNLYALEIEDYMDKGEFLARLSSGNLDGAVEAVLHQGACTDTMETNGHTMLETNYAYSKALLEWCQDEELPLIYASSASVYGAGRKFAEVRENEAPLNVYAYSKFLFDQVVRRRLGERSAQIAGLRYFNVYGPNEAHKKRTRMHSIALQAYEQFKASGAVQLFVGSDGFGDGEQRRDFVHVDDAVAVNLWLLDRRDVSGIFNCGSGRAQTFNEVAAAVINTVNGTQLPVGALADKGLIRYVPFPPQLVGKYQSYTQADLTRLRSTGCDTAFRAVDEGVAAYVKELLRA